MKPLIPLYLVCLMALTGCKSYVNHKYHLQRTFDFKSRHEYLQYLVSVKPFDAAHILYADAEDYQRFISEKLQQDSSVVYQGCYLNDSVCLNRSSKLSQNTSCMGRIDDEIISIFGMNEFPDSMLVNTNKISSYHLKRMSDDSLFQPHPDKKFSILLAYSYSLGTYYDGLYKKVASLNRKHPDASDVYLISIDPVYLLH